MSDESQALAEMLCGGKPEKNEAGEIAKIYTHVAVMYLLDAHIKRSDDPRATAKEILTILHYSSKNVINEEIAKLKGVCESGIGKIFGAMLGNPDEFAARMQDRLNEVHSQYAKFLTRDFEEFEAEEKS